ncbi:hypothetical protein, partial [Paraburkholderia sp. BR14427]|uniref:hypothetical protein n=1 Tax=Paraburkholderia sp. BR14427 TaxID=3237008 RepID=UPI0034CE4D05
MDIHLRVDRLSDRSLGSFYRTHGRRARTLLNKAPAGQALRHQLAPQCLRCRLEFPRLLRCHPGLSPDVAHELKHC